MKKQYVFYITNHGYGHASRNVAIIRKMFEMDENIIVHVKTDEERIQFLRRNLKELGERIVYYSGYTDVGLILNPDTLQVDAARLEREVRRELGYWDSYIEKETAFLKEYGINGIVSDILPWVLLAARKQGIPSALLCNFTWYEMYKDFLPQELCEKYYEAYCSADKIFLYALGRKMILDFDTNTEQASMIARKKNLETVGKIRNSYSHPIVFCSVGKSIEMPEAYDVSDVKATFLATAGVQLKGKNVVQLPADMINTQDYISASDYCIVKSGWSTLGEIFLNRKRAAVIPRGENSEDIAAMKEIHEKKCAVEIGFEDLKRMPEVLEKLDDLQILSLDSYTDSCTEIAQYICSM